MSTFQFSVSLEGLDDVAFGRDEKKVTTNAYEWLSDNYEPGDRIFLFGETCALSWIICPTHRYMLVGFSRGAYKVRVIAGMIHMVCSVSPYRCNELEVRYITCRLASCTREIMNILDCDYSTTPMTIL